MSLKIPVAAWQDAEGSFTVTTLDGPRAAVVDVTLAAALDQLKKCLAWGLRSGESHGVADFADLQLRDHRVQLRPKYVTETSVFPVSVAYPFRVTAVHGKRRDGGLHCVLPTLGLRFTYQQGDPLEALLEEAVVQLLGSETPQNLSRQLMPRAITLHVVHARDGRVRPRLGEGAQTPEILSVAEVVDRRGGTRFERPLLREQLVGQLLGLFSQDQANLLLLGEAGVGKTTVLVEAICQWLRRPVAERILQEGDNTKDATQTRKFWLTSGHRLIAGMKYLGQWEERCEKVIDELAETRSVLCVDNLLELVRLGGDEPGSSVAAFLAPYLERGELRLVAEATPQELDACRRLLPGFAELFQVVRVPEFSAADARTVLDKMLAEGARNHKLEVEAGLGSLIYRLFKRFQPYAAFPGRSASFARQLLHDARQTGQNGIAQPDVLLRFQRETGLPDRLLRDDLPLPHPQVLADFSAAVLGQPAACRAAASVVSALKTGLNDPRRPLGVLLFCGPTGVGKTEMAKALARYLFGAGGAKDRLVRLDMSEYAGFGAAQRLTLSAGGEASEFIKRMRRQPFVVVLLDEIEKAAPEVHDALLGVLDEGRLTDRLGRTTSFLSAVIVMTSNLGAERGAPVGFDSAAHPAFERIAMETFRPEFFNRIDEVVTFQPLERDTIAALARRELSSIAAREGFEKARLRLHWEGAVLERLTLEGYDARYGARPLLRAVERLVIAPLSQWLLANQGATDWDLTLAVDARGEIVVRA